MSVLTLLRHGQASFGAANYDDLSSKGLKQARATGAYFADRNIAFDQVLCGPRRRQQQTVEAVTAALPVCPIQEVDPALDEFAEPAQILDAAEAMFDIPVYLDPERSRKERLDYYEALIREWAEGKAMLAGGPSNREFQTTVGDWMTSILGGQLSERRILAVTSAGVIGACVSQLLNLRSEQFTQVMCVLGNCSITEIIFSSTRRSLLSFNNTSHLPTSLSTTI